MDSSTPKPPFSLARLDHVVLRAVQLEKMLAFYQALGCEVVRTLPELGLHQLQAGASMIDLVDVEGRLGRRLGAAPGPEGRNVDHIALRIDPFEPDRLEAYLTELGAEFVAPGAPLFGAEGFGPSLYVTDPDGNTVELKGPPLPQ